MKAMLWNNKRCIISFMLYFFSNHYHIQTTSISADNRTVYIEINKDLLSKAETDNDSTG